MDGLGLRVLHGQLAGDSCELESGTVGRRKRKMATGFRFYGAENIGRAAAFIFVVTTRLPSWLGRGGGTNIGVERDRLLIQTDHWFGCVVWFFIRFQAVLHVVDIILIEIGHAPH